MKILIIPGHPKKGSFNDGIAETAVQTLKCGGHEVIFHDLYEEGFDPVATYDEIPREAWLNPVISNIAKRLPWLTAL